MGEKSVTSTPHHTQEPNDRVRPRINRAQCIHWSYSDVMPTSRIGTRSSPRLLTDGTKVMIGVACVGLLIAMLTWVGAFAQRRDTWTHVPANEIMQIGPYEVRFDAATATFTDPGLEGSVASWTVKVDARIHNLETTNHTLNMSSFIGSKSGVQPSFLTIGPADSMAFGMDLVPGLGWQDFQLSFTVPASDLERTTAEFPVGVNVLMQRQTHVHLGNPTSRWVPAPAGLRTKVPLTIVEGY